MFCNKAILTNNGKEIICYYVAGVNLPALIKAEPLFAKIPGLVLQYEFKNKKEYIVYRASSVDFTPFPMAQLNIPSSGFVKKRVVIASGTTAGKLELEDEGPETIDE